VITQELSSLDWELWYSDRTKWPVDRNIFLADAVLRIARMMVFPWHDEFVVAASADPAPLLPGPIDAFHPDGTPVDEVHRAWGPTLLRYMSTDEFEAARAVRDEPASWARLYEPDPEGGPPRPRHADREDGPLRISMQHWDQAAWQAAEIESFREAGCRALPHIARELARMAIEESLSFVARPIGGGEPVDLEPDDWLVDDPAARVASCTMNIDQPRSTIAAATHLIFVRPEGFEAAAWVHARRVPLALLDEGITAQDAGVLGPKPSSVWKALEDRAVREMRRHLLLNPTQYTRPDLRRVVGDVSETVFEKARDRIGREFPFIKEGGAPRGKDRRPPAGRLRLVDD